MDKTGVLLNHLNTVKVLIARGDRQKCRGVGVRHTLITAVYISADGRRLPPLIIWPGKTLRTTWIFLDTPGWQYACSENGYMISTINLYWV